MKHPVFTLRQIFFLFIQLLSCLTYAESDSRSQKEREALDHFRATGIWQEIPGLRPKRVETPNENEACFCETEKKVFLESMNQTNGENIKPKLKSALITNTCLGCHDSKDTAFKPTPWIDDLTEWENRLNSTDPKEKKEAFHLLSQLYSTLVDAKNMPPLSEKEIRSKFFSNAEREPFVAFIKEKFESLQSDSVPRRDVSIAPNRVSVMDSEQESKYRSLLPHTTSDKLNALFQDPNLIFMDKEHMVPGYQDPSTPVTGERSTEAGFKGAGFATDSPFTNKKGHLKLWSSGFGLENSPNAKSFHFIQLPRNEDGSLKRIKVSSTLTPVPDGGTLYDWEFPVGTVSGEVTLGTDSNGQHHVLQVRLRTKDQKEGPWAADIYKPYPTRESLTDKLALIAKGDSTLAAEAEKVLRGLNKPPRLRAISLGMNDYEKGDLNSHGGTETLPEMSEALTFGLLREPFKSSLGTEWAKDKTVSAFAPDSQQPFSIVSTGNDEGAVRVDRQNCSKCHKDANKPYRTFYTQQHPKYYSSIVAYANTPGSDQQLRFNPFDQTLFKTFGNTGVNDNRKINPKLLPILDLSPGLK
jgi:hypothetical protein